MSPKIGVMILAAGGSSRMGGDAKQLLEFRGKTLLRRAAETALQAGFPAVVVLGARRERFEGELEDLPLKVAVNDNWEAGISTSIKCGLAALTKDDPDAVIIMLCDQPLVTAEVLERLWDDFLASGKPIVASRYGDTVGVPALFAREIFGELNDLREDQGAKKVIAKDPVRAEFIDVPEAAFDVDTVQDLERLAGQ